MDHLDRIFTLHRTLKNSRHPVPAGKLKEKIETNSRATLYRCIADVCRYFRVPVIYNPKMRGYQFDPDSDLSCELPGLWFSAAELQTLLAMQHLLAEIQPGLLETALAPFREKIGQILKSKRLGCGQISRRIRLLGMACRQTEPEHFKLVASAVLQRKQLKITYHSRSKNQTTDRIISPQRLAYYRDNWYLDAWDHGKQALRSFAVDRIQRVALLDRNAREISDKKLDKYFATAYGIFAGKPKHTAKLRFSPERSRWVAEEIWHPQQAGRFVNKHYVLEVPYSDSRELVMDILKHSPQVEVLAPDALRREVKQRLEQALTAYRKP